MELSKYLSGNFSRGLISGVIIAVITAVIGTFVANSLAAKPNLRYEIFPANVTTSSGISSGVYAIHIANDGQKMAEELTFVATLPAANIS